MRIFVHNPRVRAKTAAMLGEALIIGGAALLAACGGQAPQPRPPSPAPSTVTVNVYFHRGQATDPAQVVAVTRAVPRSGDIPSATLGQLLAGPTAAERSAGYSSWFSQETTHMLRGTRVSNGVAYADFGDLRTVIPNASSSYGSGMLLAELDATLKQFPDVHSTVYSLNGDVAAFYEWLQRVPPDTSAAQNARAIAAASGFLQQAAGMANLGSGRVMRTGAEAAVVELRSDAGTGPVTTVTLQRQGDGTWLPAGARTAAVRVDRPTAMQAISSPVTAAGQSATFEGQLSVRVVHMAGGGATVLGRNDSLLGGSMGTGPFSGQVTFTTPPTAGTTWVAVTFQSAKTGAVAGATVVQVTPAG
jgi:hypothetical protein